MKYFLSLLIIICFTSISYAEFPKLEFNLSCKLCSNGDCFMTRDFEKGTPLHRTTTENKLQFSHITIDKVVIYLDVSRISGTGNFFSTDVMPDEVFARAVKDILELDMDYSNFQYKYKDQEMLSGELECKKVDKNLF